MKGGVEWKSKTKQSGVKDATSTALVEDVQGLTEGKSRHVTHMQAFPWDNCCTRDCKRVCRLSLIR